MDHVAPDTFQQVEKEKLREMISSWFVKEPGNFLDFFGNGDMVRHLLPKVAGPYIHAVEQNEKRAKRLKLFTSINGYIGCVRDYADVAREKGITFRVAWLDYCGPISPTAMEDTIAVMPLVDIGGMLILTLMAARERHCRIQGHEMRETEYPLHVLDAAVTAGCNFELRFKAFYAGKHKQSTMLVLGFKRTNNRTDAVSKAWAMPSVLTAEETDGLRVVGAFGK